MGASNYFGKTGQNSADVNEDDVVNIVDLTLVAGAFGDTARAPGMWLLIWQSRLPETKFNSGYTKHGRIETCCVCVSSLFSLLNPVFHFSRN
ncbi:hypothetical protein F4X10_15275 [Candidatus Poribacteria bacterium]|nr:hypothetical protein [Candidatus Poribacteria bacterium]